MELFFPISTLFTVFLYFFIKNKKQKHEKALALASCGPIPLSNTRLIDSISLHDLPKYLSNLFEKNFDCEDEIEVNYLGKDTFFSIYMEVNRGLILDIFPPDLLEDDLDRWTEQVRKIIESNRFPVQYTDDDCFASIRIGQDRYSGIYPFILEILEAHPVHLRYNRFHIVYYKA